jgi:hypothetical protein
LNFIRARPAQTYRPAVLAALDLGILAGCGSSRPSEACRAQVDTTSASGEAGSGGEDAVQASEKDWQSVIEAAGGSQ